MRVEIGDFKLFDHADGDGSSFYEHSGRITRLLQESSPIGAADITVYNRTTKRTELQFSISKPASGDSDDALGEWFSHEADIPTDEVLRFTSATRIVEITGQLSTLGLPRRINTRLFYDYTFIGGIPAVTDAEGAAVSASRHFQTLAISATGDTTPSLGAAIRDKELLIQAAAGSGGAYTHVVIITTTGRQNCDRCFGRLEFTASDNATVEFRLGSSGGTLLDSRTGTALGATNYAFRFSHNGTAWKRMSFQNEP